MPEHKANLDLNTGAPRRKPWATPLVIMSTLSDAQSKGPLTLATPDSHTFSQDYGRNS